MSFASSNVISDPDFLAVENTPMEVIVPLASANTPGFQEGSIYSNSTLSNGRQHTCAILNNASVVCWGDGTHGELGNGGTSSSSTPVLTSSFGIGRTAVDISLAKTSTNFVQQLDHACVILDNGSVSCWGTGGFGQLGNGGTSNSNNPVLTSSLGTGRTAVAISSGRAHTCAILDDGSVSCWGMGGSGQLGNAASSNKNSPTQTSSLGTGRTAIAISSGYEHTCALLDNGSVSCWGNNDDGQLGTGSNDWENTPTLTDNLGTGRTAVAISSGFWHTCAILDNGNISCWGNGYFGEIGNGGTSDKNNPTPTSGLGTGRTAISISAGMYYTCAILDNYDVSCWGRGWYGVLGSNGTSDRSNFPPSEARAARKLSISFRAFDSCSFVQ